MTAADEQHLITAARNGSREAFRCLVELHMRSVYSLAFRFVDDHQDAEEIAQDAFVRLYGSFSAFRNDAMYYLENIGGEKARAALLELPNGQLAQFP